MLRLMKLEMKKFKLGWYVRAIIANIAILTLLIFTSIVSQIEGDQK